MGAIPLRPSEGRSCILLAHTGESGVWVVARLDRSGSLSQKQPLPVVHAGSLLTERYVARSASA